MFKYRSYPHALMDSTTPKTKRYYHTTYTTTYNPNTKKRDIRRLNARIFSFNGRQVITVQVTRYEKEYFDYALIPGYVVSREGNVSNVEPITDTKERKELSDLVRSELKGPLHFW